MAAGSRECRVGDGSAWGAPLASGDYGQRYIFVNRERKVGRRCDETAGLRLVVPTGRSDGMGRVGDRVSTKSSRRRCDDSDSKVDIERRIICDTNYYGTLGP